MRLREGESNLLAGLVREEDRKVLQRRPRPAAHSDPQGHPRRHRGAGHHDRHRDPADAAHRPHARADAGAPQPDLHRLADQPRAQRTDADDRRRAAAGARPSRRPRHRRAAGGRVADQPVADAGRRDLDAGRGPAAPQPPRHRPARIRRRSASRRRPSRRRRRAPRRRRCRRPRRRHATAHAARGGPAEAAPPAPSPEAPARADPRRRRSASRRRGRSSASAAGRTRCRSRSATPRACR